MSLNKHAIELFAQKLRAQEVTAHAVTEAVMDAIDADSTNAFITPADRETALQSAAEADQSLASGQDTGPLMGVPIAIKDNICTRGVRTTAASKILGDFVPPYDATVIRKLREAGAVIVGKANLDEFAMGSSNESSFYGAVNHPTHPDYVPGGSSGGSAAAVAADLCLAALGSDTGGSVRQPAALCGVVGLKPTYGRVSRYGLIAFASSLDQIGPITKTVGDAAILLDAIGGPCEFDMTSMDVPTGNYRASVDAGVGGMKIGVPHEYFELAGAADAIDPQVSNAVREALATLESQGAELVDISLPHTEYAVATYYLIATAEASSNLSRFDGVRYGHRSEKAGDLIELYENTRSEGFGPEVKRRIMLGSYVLSAGFYDAYYKKAQQVRTLITRDFHEAFSKVDAIVTPTTPSPAFKKGEKTSDPLQMYLEDIYTISCNLAGIPGISVPCGQTDAGLPIGLQVLAPAFDEDALFKVAGEWERSSK